MAIFFGHMSKRFFSSSGIFFGVVGVPVNNHINPLVNRSFNDTLCFGDIAFRVSFVAAVFLSAYGRANNARIPFLHGVANSLGVIKFFTAPALVAPKQAWPGKRNDVAMLIHNLVAFD